MCKLGTLSLFLCGLFASQEYFFDKTVADLEIDCIRKYFEKMHEVVNVLDLDKIEKAKSKSLLFISLDPISKLYEVFQYSKDGSKVEKKNFSQQIKCGKDGYDEEKFVEDVCKDIKKANGNVVPEIHYYINICKGAYHKTKENVNGLYQKYKNLFKKAFPEAEDVKRLPCLFNKLIFSKDNDKMKAIGDNEYYKNEIIPFLSCDEVMENKDEIIKEFETRLMNFEQTQLEIAAKKYFPDYVKTKKENKKSEEDSNKEDLDNIILAQNRANLYHLYIFELLKKNKKYTEEIVSEHFDFFISLISYIINKETFEVHFKELNEDRKLYLSESIKKEKTEKDEPLIRLKETNTNLDSESDSGKLYQYSIDSKKENIVESLGDRIKELGITKLSEEKEDNTDSELNNQYITYLKNEGKGLACKIILNFFETVFKKMNLLKETCLSRDIDYIFEVKSINANLRKKAIAGVQNSVERFFDIYTGKLLITDFPENDQKLFLKFRDVCVEQIKLKIDGKNAIFPQILKKLQNFFKINN